MYRAKILKRILETKVYRMTTGQIVEASDISKQGFVQMMRRLNIQPCDVIKSRGQFGHYIWDMRQVRAALKKELSTVLEKLHDTTNR